MTELCDLCQKYGTDKGPREMNGWGYSPVYHSWLNSRRADVKKVLEIGICGFRDIPNNVVGASLFVWRDYFPNAEIYGIDNDARFVFNDKPRIHTAKADAYNPMELQAAIDSMCPDGLFDFICDDAVHDPVPQINLLNHLWPLLSADGIYAMEDVCPYKVPDNNLENMIKLFPEGAKTTIVSTHKDERLLLIRR
jgi:trans-aconitate methyltransferase